MTTYTLTVAPKSARWWKITNDAASYALTGALQTTGRTGNRWHCSLSWTRDRDNFRVISALLDQLHGQRHRISIPWSKLGYVRAGVGGGVPLLNGAHSSGATTANIKGMSLSTTGVLQPGDWLQIGNQLVRAVTILSSDGSGNGSCTIFPELHKAYADSQAVDYDSPEGVFFWVNDSGNEQDHKGIGTISAEFEQDVLA